MDCSGPPCVLFSVFALPGCVILPKTYLSMSAALISPEAFSGQSLPRA
jgi:hypothetical protein